jgi:hypothetical protein
MPLVGVMAEIGRWMDAQKQIKSFLGRGAKATMDKQTLEQLMGDDPTAANIFVSEVERFGNLDEIRGPRAVGSNYRAG